VHRIMTFAGLENTLMKHNVSAADLRPFPETPSHANLGHPEEGAEKGS
jgi:hypothetical protein